MKSLISIIPEEENIMGICFGRISCISATTIQYQQCEFTLYGKSQQRIFTTAIWWQLRRNPRQGKNRQKNREKRNKSFAHLLAHRDHQPAVARLVPHHTMDPPLAADRDEGRIEEAVHLQYNIAHVEGDQSRRIAPPIHMRLVARDIRVVNDRRVRDHRVHHRRRRNERIRRPSHSHGPPRRRRDLSVLPGVHPLRHLQTVLDGPHELLLRHLCPISAQRHGFGKESPPLRRGAGGGEQEEERKARRERQGSEIGLEAATKQHLLLR